MATIKSYTDLEQSKRLAEILPLESADMNYWCGTQIRIGGHRTMDKDLDIPCWSLASLLGVLPNNYVDVDDMVKHPNLMKTKDGLYMIIYSPSLYTSLYNNPVDACYEMVIKLYELKML